MDKLHAMAAFVQIAERGSLTAAADALDTSLSSVVRTLAALEDSLGVRLLNRTTRRIALTEEGRRYLERCRRILAEVEDAEQALGAGEQDPAGVLRVTAPVLFGQLHVAPAVAGFLARHRRMQVELTLLDRVVNLVDEGIDVAVRIGALADSSMVAAPVGQIRRVVAASPALLKAAGTPKRPEELAKLPCVRFTSLMPGTTWHFFEAGKPFAVQVGGQFACNQAAACVDACIAGLGFGMFISYQVRRALDAKQLREVLKDFEPPPLPVSLVYPHARLLSPRVRAFVDFAAAELRRELATARSPAR
ncbi:MAG: LysR family transcriptional regulator [Pseudomonadota bacterium]